MDTGKIKLYKPSHPLRPNAIYQCQKCNDFIRPGDEHRVNINQTKRWCINCVGFFLARYSFTFVIPDPTESEQAVENLVIARAQLAAGTRFEPWVVPSLPPPIPQLSPSYEVEKNEQPSNL